jgi:plastocyanin
MSFVPFGRASVVGLALAAWLVIPSTPALAQGAAPPINMRSDTFDVTEVHVAPGQTVMWNNSSNQTHTVTADDGSFDSGDVNAGANFRMEFDAPGSYPYFCEYHGGPGGDGMSGVIVVDG